MEPWEAIARERIRDTIARYAHCADSGRFVELAALFTTDGVLEIHGREPLAGRDEILAFLGAAKKSLAAGSARPYIRHHVSSTQIDVEGPETARAASYFLAITDRGVDHWGRYRDDLVRTDGRWLFQRRLVRPDGRASSGWAATRSDSL